MIPAYWCYCVALKNGQLMESAQVSINRWMGKENYTYIDAHTNNGVLFGLKQERALSFVENWMELETIMLYEITVSQRHTSPLLFHMKPKGDCYMCTREWEETE